MSGPPVWLASIVSRAHRGKPIGVDRWSGSKLAQARQVASEVLVDVGCPEAERAIGMFISACVHRLATPAEIAAIPPGPGSLAGPPVYGMLWETSGAPPMSPSFLPCDRRTFRTIRLSDGQAMRTPVDECGACPSCRARNDIISRSLGRSE